MKGLRDQVLCLSRTPFAALRAISVVWPSLCEGFCCPTGFFRGCVCDPCVPTGDYHHASPHKRIYSNASLNVIFIQDYLGLVQAEVRAENEMVEEFVREQMGISAIAKVGKDCPCPCLNEK